MFIYVYLLIICVYNVVVYDKPFPVQAVCLLDDARTAPAVLPSAQKRISFSKYIFLLAILEPVLPLVPWLLWLDRKLEGSISMCGTNTWASAT